MRPGAAIALVLLLSPAMPLAAKDAWITLRTPHFTILSNASERSTRDTARRLEQFVGALTSLPGGRLAADAPVTVHLFRDDSTFRPFRPRENGKTLDVAGYFQRADDEHLIALSLGQHDGEFPLRVVFHEYAHVLMSRASYVWPLWLTEGLAEFYSTFDAFGTKVVLGHPIREYGPLIAGEGLMPLQKLLDVDKRSPLYTEDSRNLFYAQSWLLVHYLMTADGGAHQPSLAAFVSRLEAGEPPNAAFAAVFGGIPVMEETVRRYLKMASFVGLIVNLDRRAADVSPPVRRLSDAEGEVVLGNLLTRIGRPAEAQPYFDRASALNPSAPRLEECLGFLHLNGGRYSEALGHLSRAIAQEPSNALAHYYYAETLRRQVTEQGTPLTPAVAGAMVEPLRAAIRLRPDFARAYYVLGHVHLVAGLDLAEGVKLLDTAIRLMPPYRAATLTLASVQLKMGNLTAARTTAQTLIDAPDASEEIKAEARLVLVAAGG